MEKEEYITASEIAFERLMDASRGLQASVLEESISEGKWSFKEIAIHFCFWNTILIRALENLNQDKDFDWQPYWNMDKRTRRNKAQSETGQTYS
jgi:hypothetical protein